MNYRERIAESPVTEWEGVQLRVSLGLPSMSRTMSSQMVIGLEDLHLLKDLLRPKYIELMDERDVHLALMEWDGRRKNAERVVEMIANKVAIQITRAIGAEI